MQNVPFPCRWLELIGLDCSLQVVMEVMILFTSGCYDRFQPVDENFKKQQLQESYTRINSRNKHQIQNQVQGYYLLDETIHTFLCSILPDCDDLITQTRVV